MICRLLASLLATVALGATARATESADEVEFFEKQWVKMDAPDPRIVELETRNPEPETRNNHWAYQPLAKAAPPPVTDTSWPLTDLDRFILAKIEERGLQPAPPADPATLCRRLYFDLTGLPPTPDELDVFQKSAIANPQSAISNLVDRLLASPRFGEHFGRHWLDVARFGESLTLRGFILKEAWRYRDYVIDAFTRSSPTKTRTATSQRTQCSSCRKTSQQPTYEGLLQNLKPETRNPKQSRSPSSRLRARRTSGLSKKTSKS